MGKKKKRSAGGNSSANKGDAETKEEASEMKAVTLEFNCLCDGCRRRIKRGTDKATIAGPPELSVEESKSQVTVKGKLGVEPEYLACLVKNELGRRSVAVVPPPKKEADGEAADKKKNNNNKDQAQGDPPQTQQPPGYTRDGGYWYGYPVENIRTEPVYYHPGWGCPCRYNPQICQCGYNPQIFSCLWPGGGY